MKEKLIIILIIILAFIIPSAHSFCCGNPGGITSDALLCYDFPIEEESCCPDVSGEYGKAGYPKDKNDCMVNYFGDSCNKVISCITGCCCDYSSGTINAIADISKAGCLLKSEENDFFAEKLNYEQCSEICEQPIEDSEILEQESAQEETVTKEGLLRAEWEFNVAS